MCPRVGVSLSTRAASLGNGKTWKLSLCVLIPENAYEREDDVSTSNIALKLCSLKWREPRVCLILVGCTLRTHACMLTLCTCSKLEQHQHHQQHRVVEGV